MQSGNLQCTLKKNLNKKTNKYCGYTYDQTAFFKRIKLRETFTGVRVSPGEAWVWQQKWRQTSTKNLLFRLFHASKDNVRVPKGQGRTFFNWTCYGDNKDLLGTESTKTAFVSRVLETPPYQARKCANKSTVRHFTFLFRKINNRKNERKV